MSRRRFPVHAGELLAISYGSHHVALPVPASASHPTILSRPIWIGRSQIEDTPLQAILLKTPCIFLELNPQSLAGLKSDFIYFKF